MPQIKMKIVIVGDKSVGKSSLYRRYVEDTFYDSEDNIPPIATVPEYETEICVDNFSVKANLHDSAVGEDYDGVRPLLYIMADVIIICFSLNDRSSFENILEKWLPELKVHASRVPYLLVGLKSDLEAKITLMDAIAMKDNINAIDYKQCSAKDGYGVKEIFIAALNNYRQMKRPRKKPCAIS